MAGRINQDVVIVGTLPTSSKVRTDADLTLVAALPTSSKVRWDAEVMLVALGKVHPKVWVTD